MKKKKSKKLSSPGIIALEIVNHYNNDYEIPIGLAREIAEAIEKERDLKRS